MSEQPTNCKDCEHGWLALTYLCGSACLVRRAMECRKAGRNSWQGEQYPDQITPPDWCPLRKGTPE